MVNFISLFSFRPVKLVINDRNNLHIAFGVQAGAVLQQSGIYDTGKSKTVCLQDYLSIGPVLDLETQKGRNRRINWLSEICQGFGADEIGRIVDSDGQLIEKLKDDMNLYDRIYLWVGADVSEMLSASRLLYVLQLQDCSRLFIIGFLNSSLIRHIGTFMYPKSLSVKAPDEVAALYNNCRVIEQQEVSEMQALWERLRIDDAYLRISKEGTTISACEMDFYDPNILVHCTNRYQGAYRVIGKTLGYVNEGSMREGIPDSFLSWRLINLIKQGTLKYRGALSSMRDYEVKLA